MDNALIQHKGKKRKRKKKSDKLYFTLTIRDQILLTRFCKVNNLSKTAALKKIIHLFLQENTDQDFEQQPENQLDLFEPLQMDIFDVIRK